jgi:hypothetical protein
MIMRKNGAFWGHVAVIWRGYTPPRECYIVLQSTENKFIPDGEKTVFSMTLWFRFAGKTPSSDGVLRNRMCTACLGKRFVFLIEYSPYTL